MLRPEVPLTGGVTEWPRISAGAEAFGATLSPHFPPELHVHDGRVAPPDRPGHGMSWNLSALDDLRVR
ncbi:hypothetical protein AB0F91_04265 [Amycolatopsis sp. NPDC023774]|uniref:hypothetical protein n=1 Tax=Amycolatopsis sp. NPDC023774 TaxID=3155015 RepID=UPI0033DBE33A